MKSTGDLVAVVIELAAGVQHRHDDLESRFAALVIFYRYSAPIILNGNSAVEVKVDLNVVTPTLQGFIDGIVQHFIHEVMKSRGICAADVHIGALTDSFQTLEHLDAAGVIRVTWVHTERHGLFHLLPLLTGGFGRFHGLSSTQGLMRRRELSHTR